MNWDMLSAVGELVGVAVVIISLLYLSRQVKMSNQLARAEAPRMPNSDLNMLNASFASSAEFRIPLWSRRM